MNTPNGEVVLDVTAPRGLPFLLEARQTDPFVVPTPYAAPSDMAAVYPQIVPTSEIVTMCEELSVWSYLPEVTNGLKTETWRELNELAFTSGSQYISFADGTCPEEYAHDGDTKVVPLKNIGIHKQLGESDIMDSAAKSTMNQAITRLIGPGAASAGMPGGSEAVTFEEAVVMDLKAREMRLGLSLVLNGWDRLLVNGDAGSNALEFDGISQLLTNEGCSPHTNDNAASGTFDSDAFDRFLSESCAKPQVIMGHPQAVQEMLSSYFQLGFAGSQVINVNDGGNVVPGFNFGGFVNTGIGRLPVVADNNFTKTGIGSTTSFQSKLYAMRLTWHGTPLMYKRTQIPLMIKDLVNGCTTIRFMAWAKTALIIKHCCAHGVYTSQFAGRTVTTCPVIQ